MFCATDAAVSTVVGGGQDRAIQQSYRRFTGWILEPFGIFLKCLGSGADFVRFLRVLDGMGGDVRIMTRVKFSSPESVPAPILRGHLCKTTRARIWLSSQVMVRFRAANPEKPLLSASPAVGTPPWSKPHGGYAKGCGDP